MMFFKLFSFLLVEMLQTGLLFSQPVEELKINCSKIQDSLLLFSFFYMLLFKGGCCLWFLMGYIHSQFLILDPLIFWD